MGSRHAKGPKKIWDVRWPEQTEERRPLVLKGFEKTERTLPRSVRVGAGIVVVAFAVFFLVANQFYKTNSRGEKSRVATPRPTEIASVFSDMKSKFEAIAGDVGESIGETKNTLEKLALLAAEASELEDNALSLFFGGRGIELVSRLARVRAQIAALNAERIVVPQSSASIPFADPQLVRAEKFLGALIRWLSADEERRVRIAFVNKEEHATLAVQGGGLASISEVDYASSTVDATLVFSDRALNELFGATAQSSLGTDAGRAAREAFIALAERLRAADARVQRATFEAAAALISGKEILFFFKDTDLQSFFEGTSEHE